MNVIEVEDTIMISDKTMTLRDCLALAEERAALVIEEARADNDRQAKLNPSLEFRVSDAAYDKAKDGFIEAFVGTMVKAGKVQLPTPEQR